jgi:solute carrier family 38 (sodium-coupled neutral amino acid transporter), member 11
MRGGKSNGKAPRTVPPSPFFHPSTPRVVVVQQTPRGTRRSVPQKEEVTETKSSIVGCSANLMNAIVGAGIVGIPYAIQQAGFCSGIVLILLVAALTDTSLRWLINTAKHVHVGSYETLAEAAFGINGFRFVAANMGVMAYGAMLSYLTILRETFATVLLGTSHDETVLVQKRAILFAVSLCIMVPLSSQRDMAGMWMHNDRLCFALAVSADRSS